MGKSGASELFSTLKGYFNQLSEGERTPAEVASALNEWARESAESIKFRVQEEVEAAVLRMGFVKREEFEALENRITLLETALLNSEKPSTKRKISFPKLTTSKLGTNKASKRDVGAVSHKSSKKIGEDKGGKK